MVAKKNPLKLNSLQLRTLTLCQVLAREESLTTTDINDNSITINQMPHVHGNHVHIGKFVVSARDASGFSNPAVWVALKRKNLIKEIPSMSLTLTAEGVSYETGLSDQFVEESDH